MEASEIKIEEVEHPEIKQEPLDTPDIKSAGNVKNNAELENQDVVYTGKVVQVTNVSPGATLQQMATLFGFVGTVSDIRLYPSDDTVQVAVKVCYIKYENSTQCGVAQHLTNTVFIDRALIVVPISLEEIPEETECAHLIKTVNLYAAMATTGFLPQAFPVEASTSSIPGLPPPPVITCSTDPVEIEEIRRTIFVKNIHESIKSEQLMAFFSGVGEVKFLRLCKAEGGQYAFIEFSDVESVPTALQYNGVIFGNRSLRVVHSKGAISKPESERIASGRTPVYKYRESVRRPSFDRHMSRSRSPARRRSRSGSRSRRRRSRSRSRRRGSRTRSPPRGRSARARSPIVKRRRSRSRSRDRRRRKRTPSKSPSRSPRRKSRKRSKSRSPTRRKSKRSPSRSPSRRKKKEKEKEREKDKDRSKDKEKPKEGDTEKELDHLLNKIHAYEEEQKKTQESSDESSKKKKIKKESSS